MKAKNTFYPAALLFTAIFFLPLTSSAQDGTLDITFDADGTATTNIAAANDDNGYGIAVQSDGKIVLVGVSGTGSGNDVAVVRYSANGTLDNSFDTDGIAITPVGTGQDVGFSVAIQADGKIVVAGYSHNGTNYDIAVVRYNSNGSLDNTFDNDGTVTTAIGTGEDRAYSVAIQSDGKIVVAGHSHNGTNYDFAVVRYNINGSLDNSFDGDGKLTTNIGTNDDGYSVGIQGDGKIVVGGSSFSGTSWDVALVRYNSDGSLDNTFDTDGKTTTDFGTDTYEKGNSVIIQPDGKIVLAGFSYVSGFSDFAVARYNSNGSLDNTFDTDGKVTTGFGTGADDGFSAVLQPDGKIVVAGSSHNGTDYDMSLARYNTNGSLDNTFSSDGKVTTAVGSFLDAGYAVAMQADGKIVAGGFSFSGNNNNFAVARYLGSSIATGVNTLADGNSEMKIYPNPFSSQVTLETRNNLNDATLTVYNSLGQTVKEVKNISGQKITLSRDEISNGIYFIRLVEDNKIIGKELLIAE